MFSHKKKQFQQVFNKRETNPNSAAILLILIYFGLCTQEIIDKVVFDFLVNFYWRNSNLFFHHQLFSWRIHIFFIGNQFAKVLTLKMVEKLSNLLSTSKLKNANTKNFGWTLSKWFNFFNFRFTEAKFLHNCFWHNLIGNMVLRAYARNNRKIVNFT